MYLIRPLFYLFMISLVACDKPVEAPYDVNPEVNAKHSPDAIEFPSSNACFTIETNIRNKMRVSEYFAFDVAIVKSCVPLNTINRIGYNATMPAHGHGMSSSPEITASTVAGSYRVEGSMFQMAGQWLATFEIAYGNKLEIVEVDLSL